MQCRTVRRRTGRVFLVGVLLLATASVGADSTSARCDIYPTGDDQPTASVGCRFYQAQGHVVITREDGPQYDLLPVEGRYAQFTDDRGRPVTREHGLGDAGLIFRLPEESVFVYWTPAQAERCDKANNATWPYCSSDYDATTLLRCRGVNETAWNTCPAGVLHMEHGQASVVITDPTGDEFTINVMRDYVK